MNKTVLAIGILITAALVAVFFLVMGKDPGHIDSPLIGRPAPTFTLRAVGTGQPLSLEQLRGKPVVINFWATWCMPCYQEHPVLVQNARMLGDNVQFVGVVFNDTEDKIQQFLNARGSAYPTVIDEAGKTAIAYGVGGVPETFFVDKTGNIVAKYEGPMDGDTLQSYVAKVTQ